MKTELRATFREGAIVGVYVIVFLVVLPAFLAGLGLRLDSHFAWRDPGPLWRGVGLAIGALGLAGMVWTMTHLSLRGRGLPISHLPPTRFVDDGPYRIVRHPIYVAYTLLIGGAGLTMGSPGVGFGATGLLLAGWLIYALGFEEPKLLARFGPDYGEYRRRVPVLRFPGRHLATRVGARAWGLARGPVERLANHVVLCRVGPTVWATYGVLLGLGALAMGSLTGASLIRGGRTPHEVTVFLLSLAVAMLVAGRVVWLAYHTRQLLADPVCVLRTVGFVSWGGVLGALLLPFLHAGLRSLDPFWFLDRTLLGLAVCTVPGRLACLTYGCCFGRPSDAGITWTHPAAKVNRSPGSDGNVPRVPTQLLEAGWVVVLLAIAVLSTRRPVPAGVVSGLILVLYGLGRFAADCLRDEVRFGGWRLTAGQIGSAVIGILGFTLLFVLVFLVAGFHWRQIGRW